MQTIICAVRNCGFCSPSGFCLNRLVSINEQGVCKYLTKPGWDQQVDRKMKSSYRFWMEEEKEDSQGRVYLSEGEKDAGAGATQDQTDPKDNQGPD